TLFVGSYGGPTRRAFSALGAEANIAARLMQKAGPGEILVSATMVRALEGAFRVEEGLSLHLKGTEEKIDAFLVTGARRGRSVRLLEPAFGLPMSGRTAERQAIREGIDAVQAGSLRVVAIEGEAGLGKSRLLAEVVKEARGRGFACLGGACQADSALNSYLPWRSVFGALLSIDPDQSLHDRLEALSASLDALVEGSGSSLGLLGPLLGIEIPLEGESAKLGAEGRKTALHRLLGACLGAAAGDAPLLVALEDFHWADYLSVELLGYLAGILESRPLLFLVAMRPGGGSVGSFLPGRSQRIALPELPRDDCEALASAKWKQLFPSGVPLSRALLDAVLVRSQGNPFFIEELLNYIHDRKGDPGLSPGAEGAALDLPQSVQSLILSRIDRLADREKMTLKVASVVGRLFRASWLPGYYPELGDIAEVKKHLFVLEGLDITPLDSPEPELSYLFKHVMTHEVAYETLPYETRSELHERLAGYLEVTYAAEPPLDTLAFHYGRSANEAKRRRYLRLAAEAAAAGWANASAIDYYTRLLGEALDPRERSGVLVDRGEVFDTIGNIDAALADFREATGMAEAAGDPGLLAKASQLVGAMLGLKSEFEEALVWLGTSERAYEALGDPGPRARALNDLALILARKGDFARAGESLTLALALAREAGDKVAASSALNYLGSVAHAQGDYEAARAHFLESLELKREMGEVNRIANSLNNLGILVMDQGNYDEARLFLEESLALRRKMGDKSGIAFCLSNLGTMRHHLGLLAEAAGLFSESKALLRELGDRDSLAMCLANIGAVEGERGRQDEARDALSESLGILAEVKGPQAAVWLLACIGKYASRRGCHEESLRLAAAAMALAASIGLALEPLAKAAIESTREAARAALEPADFDREEGLGAALDEAAAFAVAYSVLEGQAIRP
ncbi:MAG: tetratricopeptide repeat protein, partial [Spirochaetota bacterium]